MQANDLNMVICHCHSCLSSLHADATHSVMIQDACCTRGTRPSTILEER